MKRVVCLLVLCLCLFKVQSIFEDDLEDIRRLLWETPVSEACLECIAKFIDDKNCSEDRGCGVLGITQAYWKDGGRPTINNEDPNNPKAFKNCASDPYCSSAATQDYMLIYRKDCNNDSVINCHDFLRIHLLGAKNCKNLGGKVKSDSCIDIK